MRGDLFALKMYKRTTTEEHAVEMVLPYKNIEYFALTKGWFDMCVYRGCSGSTRQRAIRKGCSARVSIVVIALGVCAYGSETRAEAPETSGVPNPKPNVIPSIKQWMPDTGTYVLSPASRICVDEDDAVALSAAAGAFRADLKSFLGIELPIVRTDSPNPGDILLTMLDESGFEAKNLGREGYVAEISDAVTVSAESPRGLFYGTRTLLQLLKQAPHNDRMGRGTIVDFPDYPIRGFMIDVGRMPIRIEWLRAYVKFMSYYKMGDLHIHLNDNAIRRPDAYVGFRLESTTYAGLTSKDLFYTKKEYAELHDLAKTYGVTIVSEFDTPAHSRAFTRYRPDLRHPDLKSDHLDLGNPDIYPFMNALWDEYAHIFHQVHIGTDEYNGGDPEDMKRYINHYNRYLKAKGLGPVRLWGSMTTFGGAAGLDRDMLVQLWYQGYYDVASAVRDGYDFINTNHLWYTVPKAGYYNDRLDPERVYDDYHVWDLTTDGKVDRNHPQLKGGIFCVWNDVWYAERYSEMEVHDRVREPMKAFSQKMWASDTEMSWASFSALMKVLGEGPDVF